VPTTTTLAPTTKDVSTTTSVSTTQNPTTASSQSPIPTSTIATQSPVCIGSKRRNCVASPVSSTSSIPSTGSPAQDQSGNNNAKEATSLAGKVTAVGVVMFAAILSVFVVNML
jgi:hypothetical protein